MSYRGSHPHARIIEAVSEKTGWVDDDGALTDFNGILEAVVAEIGVEACIEALDNQGFDGEGYRHRLVPLHAEAMARRQPYTDSVTATTRSD